MSELEQLLADLSAARTAHYKADEALEAFVRPIVLQYLEVGNYDEARRLVNRCVGSVTYAFLLDTIRQHTIANVGR